jgi:hypothetical protein
MNGIPRVCLSACPSVHVIRAGAVSSSIAAATTKHESRPASPDGSVNG